MRSLSALCAGVLLTAGIAGCSEATTKPQPESIETATFATSLGVDLAASTKTAQGVYLRDLTVGTGATITANDSVAVRYTGYLKDGTSFNSNERPGDPLLERRLGQQQLLGAFEAGMVGMKVAGVRQIIIPPSLGYPSGELAGRIMVFRVTMVAKR
ncbi:MAG: FKBP-type peptidyl-prolyl cis-trans isomerase [Gemmatimonadaceae bacterium]